MVDLGIGGWLQRADALKLYERVINTSGDVLELGTNRGLSTYIIAAAIKATDPTRHLITIDIDLDMITAARRNPGKRHGLDVVDLRLGDEMICVAERARQATGFPVGSQRAWRGRIVHPPGTVGGLPRVSGLHWIPVRVEIRA